jgi:hypothetical protein
MACKMASGSSEAKASIWGCMSGTGASHSLRPSRPPLAGAVDFTVMVKDEPLLRTRSVKPARHRSLSGVSK